MIEEIKMASMDTNKRKIILFGYDDYLPSGKWNIHILFESVIGFQKFKYAKIIPFVLDMKKLPRNSIDLFERIEISNLYNAKALFLMHLCKNYLEKFKYE